MTLFHGGTHVIEHPVVITGDQGRDFGFAFCTANAIAKLRYIRSYEVSNV